MNPRHIAFGPRTFRFVSFIEVRMVEYMKKNVQLFSTDTSRPTIHHNFSSHAYEIDPRRFAKVSSSI